MLQISIQAHGCGSGQFWTNQVFEASPALGSRQPEQMGVTATVRAAESGHRDSGLSALRQNHGPAMFQFPGIRTAPDLDRNCLSAQVIYVPVRRTAWFQMVLDSRCQSAGSESAANVSVGTIPEFESPQFTHLYLAAAGYAQNQDIGAFIRFIDKSAIYLTKFGLPCHPAPMILIPSLDPFYLIP